MVANIRTIRKGLVCWLTATVVLSTFAGVAVAQPDLKQLVKDLGADDIARREEAMRLLTADTTVKLGELEKLLADPALNAEQRCRLSQAAKDRFMTSPRPAMGVQFDSILMDRVAIETVYDNFPASQLLQPGDIIVSCEGESLHSRSAWLRLGAHIFAREPGDKVAVVVRRGEEKLNLEIGLGSFADLPSTRGPGDDRLERAWALRAQRFAPTVREAIEPKGLVVDVKSEPTFMEAQKIARYKSQTPQAYRPRLVAGGEPRGGEMGYDEIVVLAQQDPGANAIINRAWQQQQMAQQAIGAGWGENAITQTTQQELSQLETRRVSIERTIEQNTLPGALRPDQLAQHERSLQRLRDELTRVKKQLAAIKAEAVEEQAAQIENGAQKAPAPAVPASKGK